MNNFLRYTLFAIIGLGVYVGYAWANGGPVAWPEGMVNGSIVPRQESDIRLVKEDLNIKLLDDMNSYSVNAEYTLENPGEAKAVSYGVPFIWTSGHGELSGMKKIFSISLNDKKYGCEVRDEKKFTLKDDPYELLSSQMFVDETLESGTGWCVAEISIPSGQSKLVLSYTTQMKYTDYEFTKSQFWRFKERTLIYELSPAGYWQGSVDELNINIELGLYQNRVVKQLPMSNVQEGGTLKWSYKNVDLKELKELRLVLDPKDILLSRQLVEYNKQLKNIFTRSSSTLASNNGAYKSNNVSDGSASTAWCEGSSGNGVGEWIEVNTNIEYGRDATICLVEGIILVPGYAKNQAAWVENNRIKKIRVSECGNPNNYTDVDLGEPSDSYAAGARLLSTQWRSVLPKIDGIPVDELRWQNGSSANLDPKKYQSCVRITILEVVPGTKFNDSCISEIAFPEHCGG